jgi:DNA-binding CsgD family transcriptional regulator
VLHESHDHDRRGEAADPNELDSLPEGACPWYEHNAGRADRELREDTVREIVDVLARVIASELTPRQREILLLYYATGLSEARIATILGISQPTVSQHLTGKLRNGRKVGGALRKLRKGIGQAAARTDLPVRERQVATVLNSLLRESLTRRTASALFESLNSCP